MNIIINFYEKLDKPGLFGAIGSSIKMTLIFLVAMVLLGLIAHGIERLINSILSMFLGVGFTMIFCNYLTIPGTILHELSHAFIAVITGAKVTEISFFDLSLTSLGHVSYRNRGPKFLRELQDSLTACAPVISGVIALAILWNILGNSSSIGMTVGMIYLIICVIDHMTMSIPDVINYFKGIRATSITIFLVNLVIFFVI